MEKVKSFLSSTKTLGIISAGLAIATLCISYLQTKATNEEIINKSAEKAAEIVLGNNQKETA